MSAYQLTFDGECRGLVRLELRDDIAWYWTYLLGVPGVDGYVVVHDDEVPLPRQALEIRTEGLWAELYCQQPGEHWTFGMEAFGLRVDVPTDEIGDRVPVGLDLEWEIGDPDSDGVVHGEVLVERLRVEVDARGTFFAGDAPPAEAELARWLG